MSKRPSGSSMFEQMLQTQNTQRKQQAAAEEAAFSQQLAAQRQQASANAAASQAQMDEEIRKKAAQPVRLGTLLTSPVGLLGNPVLSGTKLSG
jgi:flagellar biosynthesis/type III secretory pathway protein FliH